MADILKAKAAEAALSLIRDHSILGIGTGSTVNYFIQALSKYKGQIEACIPSSKATELFLRQHKLPVLAFDQIDELPIYIDGADEVDSQKRMIKGGGGALTREKLLASAAKEFICIVDNSKWVQSLGGFPIAIEVLPLARSFVGRQLLQMGASPEYRLGFQTDNGNIILDVSELDLSDPLSLESRLKLIPGVIENGLFAKRLADKVVLAQEEGVKIF